MPEYLSPGVYVEEIDTGNKPIEGVSTSIAGFLGVTERGPVNVPILVTSYGEFARTYGDKLTMDAFVNSNGPHWGLPYAVEGFFTNGGKEMYVTRVLDELGAQFAQFTLHDRGTAASVFSMLLRNALEGTGTIVSGLPLYLVSADLTGGSALNVGQDIRLGDGSATEYRTVDSVAVVTGATRMDLDLDFPLSRSHTLPAQGTVDAIPRTPAAGGTFTLQADSAIGDESVTLNGAAADIASLIAGIGLGELLELAIPGAPPDVVAEYRYLTSTTLLSATQTIVMLDSPLQVTHSAAATMVTRLDPTVASTTANLATPAAAGDGVVFVNPPIPGVFVEYEIVLFNKADTVNREARRLGALFSIQVEGGSVGEYPAGSLVEPITMADEVWTVNTAIGAASPNFPAASLTPPTPAESALLTPGITLLMGAGATLETVAVASVVAGTVNLAAPTVFGHGIGEPVLPSFSLMHLTASAPAGATVIAVDNRQTLQVGDVIRIDDPANEEFVVVLMLPNPSMVAPNAGMVILDGPLQFPHAGPTTTPAAPGAGVRRETTPVVDTTRPPSTLVFDVAADAEMMIVSHGTGYALGDHIRVITTTGEVEYHQIEVAPAALKPQLVTVSKATEGLYAAGTLVAQRDPEALVQALDMGDWGNRLRVSVQDEPVGLISRTTLAAVIGPTQIRLASPAGAESGTVIELLDTANNDAVIDTPLKIDFVDRTANYLITLASPGLTATQQAAIAASIKPLGVHSREFRLTVSLLHQPDPARPQKDLIIIDAEVFRSLSMDPRHSHYFDTVIGDINGPLRLEDRRPEGQSSYIRVNDLAPTTAIAQSVRLGPETLVDLPPTGVPKPAMHPLEGGDDSVLTLDDFVYIGNDNVQPENRTGLWSLMNIDDISIIGCPGRTSATMQGALISQCEARLDRFAVLDSPPPPDDSMNDVQFQRQQYDTKYAALYYPWLLIPDPFPENLSNISNVAIPPAGHVAGVYANVDINRGVHKAPANEVVNGIVGLQRIINGSEQDILNPFPVNINVIRDFRSNDRGIRIWGARVISSDSDYKYVNVRRLLIFIEKSLNEGLQWVVFEPNAQPLWARVVRSISAFLTVVWRNGALQGATKDQAFFVKCDSTTMTQTDIDDGRLICYVGVAPVMPAEFVIIRIGLWTANGGN